MTISSREAGENGRYGAFPLGGAEEWLSLRESVGLIGIQLNKEHADRIDIPEPEEPLIWDSWLSRVLEGESVRFGERIGAHLWVVAEIPDCWTNTPQKYIDGLARRIVEMMMADSSGLLHLPAASSLRNEQGFGTAVVTSGSGARSFKEKLYEGFLLAASRLHGWGRLEKDSIHNREMERILREGDIRSVYQPLFRLKDGAVFGYEALSRCPSGSIFDGPLALFRHAEREGYALALDRLARERAIRSCPLLGPKQKIFINVNSGIMNDPHFVSGQTRQWLAARGLSPGQVVLELTERSSIEDFEEAKRMLDHYRSQGYEIAIDDAGAGYSSLQAIVELRPDYIKLDKSLVQNADREEMKLQMLRTFVRFARKMRILTVAEGIETPDELHLVRKMGIDFGQGYLIGRPNEEPVKTYGGGFAAHWSLSR